MTRDETALVVLDGYRGRSLVSPSPAVSLAATLGDDITTLWNYWNGPGDSLGNRLDRAVAQRDSLGAGITELHVVGHSMGCQLAIRFALDALETRPLVGIGHVLLIAPDPKFRPVARDAEETSAGFVSAHDEASALWGGGGSPGVRFGAALRAVANEASSMRVVYCRADGIAEWSANVELLIADLQLADEVELVEATDGRAVSQSGVVVDLESTNAGGDVHDRLWQAVRIDSTEDVSR